jgi:hypothetical protein
MIEVDTTALLGAATAMKKLEADERKNVAKVTRTTLTPAWQRLLRQKVVTLQQRATYGKGRVSMSAGGKGTLVATAARGMSGVQRRSMGKPEQYWMSVVDYGSRGRYGGTGQLPSHLGGGRIVQPSVKAFAGFAAQAWLWALAEALRDTGIAEDA